VTRKTTIVVVALTVIFAAFAALLWLRHFSDVFSARAQPSGLERWLANEARHFAMPSESKRLKNAVVYSPEVLEAARAHGADHCASCHANNGSGDTQIGRNLYPKAPDMRGPPTQQLIGRPTATIRLGADEFYGLSGLPFRLASSPEGGA